MPGPRTLPSRVHRLRRIKLQDPDNLSWIGSSPLTIEFRNDRGGQYRELKRHPFKLGDGYHNSFQDRDRWELVFSRWRNHSLVACGWTKPSDSGEICAGSNGRVFRFVDCYER